MTGGIPEAFSKIYEVKIIILKAAIDFFLSFFPLSGDSIGSKLGDGSGQSKCRMQVIHL